MGTGANTVEHALLIALRHPLRRKILRAMAARRPISPRQIADELREPLPKVSYHVRVLAKYGAIRLVGTVPVRGSTQHFYSPAIGESWALAVLGLSGNHGDRPGDEDGVAAP